MIAATIGVLLPAAPAIAQQFVDGLAQPVFNVTGANLITHNVWVEIPNLDTDRDGINDVRITNAVTEIGTLCKENGLDLVVGGGVSRDSIDALLCARDTHLTRFETRKVVFDADALDRPNLERGLLNAVHFELLWLLNKRDYYASIVHEDPVRLTTLRAELRELGVTLRDAA